MPKGTRRKCPNAIQALRLLQLVNADRAAAATRLVHHWQARSAMLVKFPARFLHGFIRATTRRRRAHDRCDRYLRRASVICGHAATHVALGDDADQFYAVSLLHDRRAAAARIAYGSRSVCRRVLRRAARRRFDWLHHVTTTTHGAPHRAADIATALYPCTVACGTTFTPVCAIEYMSLQKRRTPCPPTASMNPMPGPGKPTRDKAAVAGMERPLRCVPWPSITSTSGNDGPVHF